MVILQTMKTRCIYPEATRGKTSNSCTQLGLYLKYIFTGNLCLSDSIDYYCVALLTNAKSVNLPLIASTPDENIIIIDKQVSYYT